MSTRTHNHARCEAPAACGGCRGVVPLRLEAVEIKL
jgi:hypothetical protein